MERRYRLPDLSKKLQRFESRWYRDLNGILEKLDYIKSLGVSIIWLCPIYKSPNKDNGYDISDYRAIMSEFGSMDDFDKLLEEIHARGMRIIMDLLPTIPPTSINGF